MEIVDCKYHPGLPGRWHCPHCQISYCANCLSLPDTADKNEATPACIVCGLPTESLGSNRSIIPFWERLHAAFIFPLSKVPFNLLLFLTLVMLIFDTTQINVVAYVFGVLIALKYAYAILEDTARGYMRPRPFEIDVIAGEIELPLKQIAILFLYAGIGYALKYYVSSDVASVYGLIIIFMMPASIMVLAVKHNWFSAFNFRLIMHVIRHIGWAYLLLYAFVLLFISAANILSGYAGRYLPASLVTPIQFYVYMHFVLSIYYLMGYVLYQYHEKLGFNIEYDALEASAINPEETRITGHLKDISLLVQEGEYALAEKRLEKYIETHPGDMDARAYYQRLVTVLEQPEKARAHCAEFVSRLMDEKLMALAMKIFLACYRKDREVTLNKPAHRLAMAELLLEHRHPREAIALLENMHVAFPTYDGTPKAYLLAAKIMSEQFSEDEKAKQVLEFVIEHFSGHPKVSEAKSYLRVLEKMASQS